jgi:hypothetical protein
MAFVKVNKKDPVLQPTVKSAESLYFKMKYNSKFDAI